MLNSIAVIGAGGWGITLAKLLAEQGIAVSLRTVERAVAPLRRELAAEARATVRFETPPGKQMQVDFGEKLNGELALGYESYRFDDARLDELEGTG